MTPSPAQATFDEMQEAKARRDVIRASVMQALRKHLPLPAELEGLLRADEIASQALDDALDAYSQIHDSPMPTIHSSPTLEIRLDEIARPAA